MTGSVATGIRRIIKENGFVQSYVAERSGFSRQDFNNMLTGRKVIRAEYLPAIANALRVDVGEIFKAGAENES